MLQTSIISREPNAVIVRMSRRRWNHLQPFYSLTVFTLQSQEEILQGSCPPTMNPKP